MNRIVVKKGPKGRRILVGGFCNIIRGNVLESACCIDCYGGMHGDNAIEKLDLHRNDVVVANKDNNYILLNGEKIYYSFVFAKDTYKNKWLQK